MVHSASIATPLRNSMTPISAGRKLPIPELAASLAGCGNPAELALLEVACGSGQLIANYRTAAGARLVGIDHSLGMPRLARRKVRMIGWIRADAALLPITDGIDYISCRFAFHQFRDKSGMLGETSRLLRPAGV